MYHERNSHVKLDQHSDETLFYAFTVRVNKFDRSYDTTNNPYPRVLFPINLKIWISKYLI